MRWHSYLLALPALAALALPAPATGLFGRRAKAPQAPVDRVQELLTTVRTSPDDRKRAEAAGELRQYDPATYSEIVPVLADVLRNDRSATVRSEAAQTLGRVRPVSQTAGQALEAAVSHDSSMRVRWQARTALVGYHLGGYHGGNPKDPEPPPGVAGSKVPEARLVGPQFPATPPPVITSVPQAPAANPAVTVPPEDPKIARPLPRGPAQPQSVPVVRTTPRPAAPAPYTTQRAPTLFPLAAAPPSSPPVQVPVTTAPPRPAVPSPAASGSEDGPVLAPPR